MLSAAVFTTEAHTMPAIWRSVSQHHFAAQCGCTCTGSAAQRCSVVTRKHDAAQCDCDGRSGSYIITVH
eukprot:19901-Heterococcus_DN1.PRE.1